MSERAFQTVITAGLLHDIGKFLQRGDFGQLSPTGKHPEVSRDFVNAWSDFFARFCDASLLAELVARHHESPGFPAHLQVSGAAEAIRPYAYMVSRADNYSSAERDDGGGNFTGNYKKTALVSIFSRLELEPPSGADYSYRLGELCPATAFPIPGRNSLDDTPYLKHIKAFGEEFKRFSQDKTVNSFDVFYTRLLNLLQTYTWCVPSSTLDATPDVSLYDHLRTTSAIVAALYRYHEETPREVTVNNKDKFRLIVGDLSGIQKYIFRPVAKGAGGIAKRLRARSFYLGVLADAVSHMLLDAFKLPIANLIMSSGGKFYVLVPNTNQATEKIATVRQTVETELLERFHGELALNMADMALSGKDFDDFSQVLKDISRQLTQEKTRPFSTVLIRQRQWQSDKLARRSSQSVASCKECGIIHDQGEICANCKQEDFIGTSLPKASRICFFREPYPAEGVPLIGGYGITIDRGIVIRDRLPYIVYNLNGIAKPGSEPEIMKSMAVHIPLHGDQAITFDQLAAQSQGAPLLACLKADVDNLGMLFTFGMDDGTKNYATISRISTLSRMLELFFSGWMNEALASTYKSCYTVYSGGDDLLIIGPWQQAIALAGEVNERFRQYTGFNVNVTISAGISLFKARFPVDNAVDKAEDLLEAAKETVNIKTGRNRNQVALLGAVLSWEDYQRMQAEAERVTRWLSEGRISIAWLYRLRRYASMYRKATGADGEIDSQGWMFASLLAYDRSRNARSLNPDIAAWIERVADKPEVWMELIPPITAYALYSNRGGKFSE